jgi:hypothetical protein
LLVRTLTFCTIAFARSFTVLSIAHSLGKSQLMLSRGASQRFNYYQ